MKTKILIFFNLSLFTFISLLAQDNKPKDIFYVDFGFNFVAIGIGINYERILNDNFSIRAGVNIAADFLMGSDLVAGVSVPLTINAMTSNKNKLAIGIGFGPRLNLTRNDKIKSLINIFPAASIGYRYQPDVKSIFVRAGFDFPANLYFSLLSIGTLR